MVRCGSGGSSSSGGGFSLQCVVLRGVQCERNVNGQRVAGQSASQPTCVSEHAAHNFETRKRISQSSVRAGQRKRDRATYLFQPRGSFSARRNSSSVWDDLDGSRSERLGALWPRRVSLKRSQIVRSSLWTSTTPTRTISSGRLVLISRKRPVMLSLVEPSLASTFHTLRGCADGFCHRRNNFFKSTPAAFHTSESSRICCMYGI